MDSEKESGFSLVTVLIGLGLAALLATTAMKMVENQFRGMESVTQKGDKEAIKRNILLADCSESLPTGVCTPGEFIELKGQQGGNIVTMVSAEVDNPTRIGKFALRAECGTDGSSIVVKAALLAPGGRLDSSTAGDFVADPLTKRKYGWNSDKTRLLPAGLNLCSTTSVTSTVEPVSAHPTMTNSATGNTVIDTQRRGNLYLRNFTNLEENTAGMRVCCDAGDFATGIGGTMAGSGANDSMQRSWRSGSTNCISMCEKACNGEIWASVWLTCSKPL